MTEVPTHKLVVSVCFYSHCGVQKTVPPPNPTHLPQDKMNLPNLPRAQGELSSSNAGTQVGEVTPSQAQHGHSWEMPPPGSGRSFHGITIRTEHERPANGDSLPEERTPCPV